METDTLSFGFIFLPCISPFHSSITSNKCSSEYKEQDKSVLFFPVCVDTVFQAQHMSSSRERRERQRETDYFRIDNTLCYVLYY